MAGVKGMKGGGGRRPGAGRKPSGTAKKQVTITITKEQREELDALRARGVNVNAALGREIHRLSVAFDLADLGIV